LEVLSFRSDSGAERSLTRRDDNSAAYKIGKSLGFNRRRLYSNNETGLAVAYIYDCTSVSTKTHGKSLLIGLANGREEDCEKNISIFS
jgi:hypothetical protein